MRRDKHRVLNGSLTNERSLIAGEEKYLVFLDRTADHAAELVALEAVVSHCEGIPAIKSVVAHKLEGIAMKFIGSRFRHCVDGSARTHSVRSILAAG